jgi:hypothetical protein
MEKMKHYIILLIGILIIGSGCEKEESSPEEISDKENPTAVISKPQNNQTYSKSESILLSATFHDDKELVQYKVGLSYNDSKAALLLEDPWKPQEETAALSLTEKSISNKELFGGAIPSNTKSGSYTVTVTVYDKADRASVYPIEITIE